MSSAKEVFSMNDNLSNFLDCIMQVNLDLDAMKDFLMAFNEGVKTHPLECKVVRRRPARRVSTPEVDSRDLSFTFFMKEYGEPSFFYEPTSDCLQKISNVFYGVKEPYQMSGLKDWINNYFVDYVKAVNAYKKVGFLVDEGAKALNDLKRRSLKFVNLVNSLDDNLFTYVNNLDCNACEVKVFELPAIVPSNEPSLLERKITFWDKLVYKLNKGFICAGRKVFSKSKRVNKWLDELEEDVELSINPVSLPPHYSVSDNNLMTVYAKGLASKHARKDLPITMRFNEKKEYPTCADCFKTLKKNYFFSIKDQVACLFQLRAPRQIGGDEYLGLRKNSIIPLVVADSDHFQDCKYSQINFSPSAKNPATKLILSGE